VIYVIMRGAVRIVSAVVLGRRLHIDGLHRIPGRGAALVVGNHVGAIDPVLLGIHIPRFDVYYMGKSELFQHRFLGWLFRRCHTFPVVRDSPDRHALRHALRLLSGGHVLLVYPEGTRSPDGRLHPPHPGAGFIARHSGAVIVPVASWGSDRVLPRGVHIPRRADVHLHVGEPFRLPSSDASGRPLTSQAASELMMARVAQLLPPEMRDALTGSAAATGTQPAA
jgi:1-acyl-sn-glycerol-3-phosphate acyltransferase